MSPLLEQLKAEVAALNQLLEAPEPGLSTWCMMVCERWEHKQCVDRPAPAPLPGWNFGSGTTGRVE